MPLRKLTPQLLATLRGGLSADELKRGEGASFLVQMLIISVTLFPYGFTIGVWRDPLQGVYAGLKFPLVVILATLFNGFINGMLGKLYGASLSLHEAMRAISTSFIIASILLGSLSPVFLFLAMSAPPLGSAGGNDAYALILLGHVAAIAVAGIVANLRLYSLIRSATADNSSARRVLCVWLILNLAVGSQLSWNLRPFIGSPVLPVQFVRPDAFNGNFFEAVWKEIVHLTG